jgi:hypothetical protein
VVQLSAQKAEEEAQSAFRAAQAKYAVLAGYQVLIRNKDRRGRGVFYAAQVGRWLATRLTASAAGSSVPAASASPNRIDATRRSWTGFCDGALPASLAAARVAQPDEP